MLNLYNSLTKQKEVFDSIKVGEVSLYVCGMTVYDYCHIGHARIFVVYDAWVRFLRHMGYKVNYVRNITDIEDKIIKRAAENQEPISDLTKRFIDAMHEDEAALGVQPPNQEPKATEFVTEMIDLIRELVDQDYAYVASNGDVYFNVHHFKEYGKLSHRKLDELLAGARIEVEEAKQSPLDFVLWKIAKPGEPSWESPWGAGRPGWHIECSAMSTKLLGQPFDIHGGGVDLKFPHHENEIAQSEAVHEHSFVNYWMHVGHVQTDSEKMSKSLGNFLTIRDALKSHSGEALRYFLLSGHYRSPINYTEENLANADQALKRFYTALRNLPKVNEIEGQEYRLRFESVLSDDFNVPEALAVLFDLVREINRFREHNEMEQAARLGKRLKTLGGVLGLLQQDPEAYFQGDLDSDKIEALISARVDARKNKDWALADQIRNQLDGMGVVIEDFPVKDKPGVVMTSWRKK